MKKETTILIGFILVRFALQYALIGPAYELHRDEYLHLDQAKHLAWGFISVPPVTSWISYLILKLGNGIFWVKFFPALFGVLTIVTVWKIIEELRGNLFALILGVVSVLFSVILRINILYQPNSLDILCWTLFFFTIIKFINSKHTKWLWIAALVFGFGFLNKYNIVFLLLGMIPALLLTEHRRIFAIPQFYFAVLLSLLIILPNLVWQYNNGYPVIHHLNDLSKTQLVNVSRSDFLKDQLLFFFGSEFVLLAAFIALLMYKPFKQYRLFIWSFLFTIMIFLYFHAKGYYAIGLYPVFLAFGAVYIEHLLAGSKRKFLKPVIIAIPGLLFLPFVTVVFPVLPPRQVQEKTQFFKGLNLLRWEDGKDHSLPQDFADMLGWKELARKADSAYAGITDKSATLILCDNYGEAGAINYYSAFKNMQAVTFNADYINWFPNASTIKNIILVKEEKNTDDSMEEERPLFDTVYQFEKINNHYAREYGTTIYVLKNAKIRLDKIMLP